MLLKRLRVLGIAAFAGILVASSPAPASANTYYMTIWHIECVDESEPFSDEIRLRFVGRTVAGWNDVDGGETHWYYSSERGIPVNIEYSGGNDSIDVLEEDGGLELIGYVPTNLGELDRGRITKAMIPPYDGRYNVTYEIRSTPCC